MRSGDGWQDVAIRNVSAHGLGIAVALPPRRGAVIEIRRASQIIVARTMWVDNNECGLRTQDVVDVAALLSPNAKRAEAVCVAAHNDRRRTPRIDDTAAHSLRNGRRLQHVALAAAVLCGAGALAWSVSDVLRAPFASISAALGGEQAGAAEASIAPVRKATSAQKAVCRAFSQCVRCTVPVSTFDPNALTIFAAPAEFISTTRVPPDGRLSIALISTLCFVHIAITCALATETLTAREIGVGEAIVSVD